MKLLVIDNNPLPIKDPPRERTFTLSSLANRYYYLTSAIQSEEDYIIPSY